MKFKIFEDWTTVLFIMIILVSTISAITYFDSDALFNAEIISVNADGKFSVDLQIENLMAENLDYDIEVIYKRGNLVVNSQTIQCEKKCQTNIPIDKIYNSYMGNV